MLHCLSEKEERKKLVLKMYSHPLEELALYVFLSYTGNFTKMYLEKDSN